MLKNNKTQKGTKMNRILMLLILIGTYVMATDVADMTLSQKQERLNKLFKEDRVVLCQVRSSREVRTVTRKARASRVRETILTHRHARVARGERKTLRLARHSRKTRFVIFLASL